MKKTKKIEKMDLIPAINSFWNGFGHNFENFSQVIHEFVDKLYW